MHLGEHTGGVGGNYEPIILIQLLAPLCRQGTFQGHPFQYLQMHGYMLETRVGRRDLNTQNTKSKRTSKSVAT